MAEVFTFEVHQDSWDSGIIRSFSVPMFDPPESELDYYGTNETTFLTYLSRYGQFTALNQTMVVLNDAAYTWTRQLGYTDVINLGYTGEPKVLKFYVNETDYLQFSSLSIDDSMASSYGGWGGIYCLVSYKDPDTGQTRTNATPGSGPFIYNPIYKGTSNGCMMQVSKSYNSSTKSNYYYRVNPVSDNELALAYNYIYFESGLQPPDQDPYAKGGSSGTGGGTGTFSGTGDSIDFPGLPTLSAVSTGFITLFNPSIAQMQSLANYMWSDLFDLDTFKKIFADPMDCILGLSIVPVAVPNGGTAEVKVGNISTGVSMTVASTQYVEVDCGTLNVKEYWGSYLDYDPYTKAEIYLPYCGTHPIAVDDIMGKSVHVKYHVDILSGACVAYVKCGSSVLYSFIGQCTSSIPITGNDWTNVVNGAISIASAIGSMVATGGATAPLVLPGVASTAVNNLKPSVEKSGSMSGTGGMLAVQTPYLILTRPRQALPKNQNTYTGYPSFIKDKLSDLKGYTEVAEIRLSGVDATDAELDEIVGLLKGGVII